MMSSCCLNIKIRLPTALLWKSSGLKLEKSKSRKVLFSCLQTITLVFCFANSVLLTKECGLVPRPLVYITQKYPEMITEKARSHEMRSLRWVLQPQFTLPAGGCPKIPLSRYTAMTAPCTGNQKYTWPRALGFGVTVFCLLVAMLNTQTPVPACHGKTPNNPSCWLLLFGPSSPAEQQKPCHAREINCWRAEKVLLIQTCKYSQTWAMSWVQFFLTPLYWFYHQVRAHWEQFWKKTKLVYPSKKWTGGQNRGQCAALLLPSLQ